MLEKELQNLGFYKNEAKIYLALLELGLSSTGPLIKKTDLHRNIVYESLDKLIAHGLVVSTVQKRKKHFRPLPPKKILKQEKIRFESAQKLIPELTKLQKKEKQEVIIYEGKEGFQNAQLDAVEQMTKNSAIYVMMAGGKKWSESMGNIIQKLDELRVHKKIKNRIIGLENQKQDLIFQSKRPLCETRFLSEKFNNQIGTAIYDDTIIFIIYGDPVLTIMIKNPKMAKSFVQYFNILWKIAKK